jgi:RNA polymerase sigma-70 factor, ECF subfamily
VPQAEFTWREAMSSRRQISRVGMESETKGELALLDLARSGDEGAFRDLTEAHRDELRAHCYRMLGSTQDAEDAVQDALLRAWRGIAKFEGRGSVRAWLYSIATNTTLDIARHRSRRELPADFGPAATVGTPIEGLMTDAGWLEPYPDRWLGDSSPVLPDAHYEQRESVEIAFMVMLQQLPPLQRAVLILRDVLAFSAAEVAAQLSTSVAAVNSALQRARASMAPGQPGHSQQSVLRALGDDGAAAIARRYADALETGDVDALLGMLTEDATWCMPPKGGWYQGHESLRTWLVTGPLSVRWRHHATRANGQLAVGCYLYDRDQDRYVPAVIDVLTLTAAGDRVSAVTAFFTGDQDPVAVFERFGLPASGLRRCGGAYQRERIPLSSILSAASFTSRATRIASVTSSSEGPGVSVLGYSKLFRARRSLLNERSARMLDPN